MNVSSFLRQLNGTINETIHLSILSDSSIIYVDRFDAAKMIRMHSKIGYAYPAYCTAVGKVLLTFQKESKREKRLHSINPHKQKGQRTPNSLAFFGKG